MSGDRRWVVRTGDGETLGAIAARAAPDDPAAIAEGRVFVGRSRATEPTAPVRAGDVVAVHAARPDAGAVRILADVGGVVAAMKPAALPTVPDHRGARDTLLGAVARLLGVPETDLSTTSRLDVGVSGVVLLARTREARARLAEARTKNLYARRYLAIASAMPVPPEGIWSTPIGRGPDPRYRVANGRDASPARSRYRVVASARGGACMLALAPETGRTHQLRVHAANASAPLFGDVPYGGPGRVVSPTGKTIRLDRIALHARSVSVPDGRDGVLVVEASVPDELVALWAALDGSPGSWDAATWP